ncbi:MAG: SPOR domain-containing protein [Gammaproteobacteria bacterium]|jgi:hypothetical protein
MERIKQKMEAARRQRKTLQQRQVTPSEAPGMYGRPIRLPDFKRFYTLLADGLRRYPWAVVVSAAVLLVWWLGSGSEPEDTRAGSPGLAPFPGGAETADLTLTDSTAEALETQAASLKERVARLTVSVADLENRLSHISTLADSVIDKVQRLAAIQPVGKPAAQPAAKGTDHAVAAAGRLQTVPGSLPGEPETPPAGVSTAMTGKTTAGKPGTKVPAEPARASQAAPPAAMQQPDSSGPEKTATGASAANGLPEAADNSPGGNGAADKPWVINLASSPSKADAERFAARARSRDIETELQPVSVKGRQYWRVQITGFPSREAARAYAATAREKLGLKDVWVTTR